MPRGQRATTGRSVGNTPGGRGPIPSSVQTMGDYYRSGRTSALNPGATVRSQSGKVLSGNAKS